MAIRITTKTIATIYNGFPTRQLFDSIVENLIMMIDIFYPPGVDPTYPPISHQSFHCSPFEVVHSISRGHASKLVNGWASAHG